MGNIDAEIEKHVLGELLADMDVEAAKNIDPECSVTIEGLGTFGSMTEAFAEWNRQRYAVHNEIMSRVLTGFVGEHFVGSGRFVRIGEDGKVYNSRGPEDADAPIIVSR